MLVSTEGIVLHFIKYKETSIITKIYTRDLGLKSYIVNSIRSGKNNKIAFFQPLTVLNLVVYNKHNSTLNRISEIRCPEPFLHLNRDPLKISISFFLTEVINKTIKEEMKNEEMYLFIKFSLKTLDILTEHFYNFHLIFLAKFSSYLGFHPSSAIQFLELCSIADFTKNEKSLLEAVLTAGYQDEIRMDALQRRKILNAFLHFYALHMEGFEHINSTKILNEILAKR